MLLFRFMLLLWVSSDIGSEDNGSFAALFEAGSEKAVAIELSLLSPEAGLIRELNICAFISAIETDGIFMWRALLVTSQLTKQAQIGSDAVAQ